jgi:hypothetical protein
MFRPFLEPAVRLATGCVLLVLTGAACTALIDSESSQCRRDEDCARFGQASCDIPRRVCLPRTVGVVIPDASTGQGDSNASCSSADTGACPESSCLPFDNKTRLKHLGAGGALRPLP